MKVFFLYFLVLFYCFNLLADDIMYARSEDLIEFSKLLKKSRSKDELRQFHHKKIKKTPSVKNLKQKKSRTKHLKNFQNHDEEPDFQRSFKQDIQTSESLQYEVYPDFNRNELYEQTYPPSTGDGTIIVEDNHLNY